MVLFLQYIMKHRIAGDQLEKMSANCLIYIYQVSYPSRNACSTRMCQCIYIMIYTFIVINAKALSERLMMQFSDLCVTHILSGNIPSAETIFLLYCHYWHS